jgi:hypothetical protein
MHKGRTYTATLHRTYQPEFHFGSFIPAYKSEPHEFTIRVPDGVMPMALFVPAFEPPTIDRIGDQGPRIVFQTVIEYVVRTYNRVIVH